MNIVIVTSWYPDIKNPFNGIFVRDQAMALAEGNTVTVISVKIDDSRFAPFFQIKEEKKSDLGFDEFLLTVSRSFPIYNQLNFFITTVHRIRKILRNRSPQLIHCHNAYPAGVIGYILSCQLKIPYFITEHSSTFAAFRTPVHRSLSLFAVRHARKLITVSRFNAGILKELTGVEAVVIPNFIRPGVFRPVERKKEPGDNSVHFGFLGGLDTNVKGLDILLKAAAGLKDINFLLHIGGGGILLESYKLLARELGIEDHCIFYGAIPPDEVPSFYNKLDFFVVSSRKETFGIACIEALCSGLPVVATRCGGPEEIINEENGVLCEKDDVQGLKIILSFMLGSYRKFEKSYISTKIYIEFNVELFEKILTSLFQNN
jgi:L-malate glycosyltransferase